MLKPETIKDLGQAFTRSPQGFLVSSAGKPEFVVLDYKKFQSLTSQSPEGKILVTGGAGYIGSHIVRLLERRGYEVVVYDNLSTGRPEAVRDSELVVGDLADQTALEKVFSENQFQAVLHFAGSIVVPESVENPGKYYQNNFVNGLNLLNAMVRHRVKNIVFSSTAAVYGEPELIPLPEVATKNPVNPYGESKLAFERALAHYHTAHNINSISLRYFNAAGAWPEEGLGESHDPETHLIPIVLEVATGQRKEIKVFGKDYPTRDGTGIRDYVHILDLAEAHVLALERIQAASGAFAYNLGTSSGYSVAEVIETAVEVTGRMIPINVVERRAGDPAILVADSSLAREELGWLPKQDLREMIQSAWDWIRSGK